jgi:hypothetical protein
VNGAGSNVYCNVTVTDNVPAGTSTSGATVDQCVGSAAGSTEACAPPWQHHKCDRHAMQRLGERRGHLCRRASRRLHRDWH